MIVIFDWDGTLFDSADHIVSAMQAAAAESDVPVPGSAEIRDIIGLGLPQAVATLFAELGERDRVTLAEAYSRQYVAGDKRPPQLFEGARETLQGLRERGLELAVATGKSRRGLDRILEVVGLTGFFEATRCADETHSKPNPLMLMEIMAERRKSSGEVLMVGDTEYDLDMARQAGVASVGVSFGVHSPQRLATHGPVAIVDKLPQLLDLPLVSGSACLA